MLADDDQPRVDAVAFSPDGKTLAAGGGRLIILRDVAKGRDLGTLKGHEAGVTTAAFSPDGKTLVSGSEGKTIRLWEVATGKAIRLGKGHQGHVIAVAFRPDGKTLASGSSDTTVLIGSLVGDNQEAGARDR